MTLGKKTNSSQYFELTHDKCCRSSETFYLI